MVEKVLEKHSADIQQIYSITTDNGANVISFVNFLRSEIEDGALFDHTFLLINLSK